MSKKSNNVIITEALERLDSMYAAVLRGHMEVAKEFLITHQDTQSEISAALQDSARKDFQAQDKNLNKNFNDLEYATTNIEYIGVILIGRDKQDTRENQQALDAQRKLAADARGALGATVRGMKKTLGQSLEKSFVRE